MTKKLQLQKTRHASYEIRRTVYFAKRGPVLTFGGYLYCPDIWGISVLS
ncbi:unnamed protein product [Staurois parvus]|uniref:Uncharacterized protein n=1 Tax=Staurois parvus TaxID=386267 RepID=A0ABN9AAD1_9NEOB|nr:unnamed protein product [Staurois parvus]